MSKPRRWALLTGAAIAVSALLAGCSGGGNASQGSTDEIDYALPANFTPN